MDHITAYRRTLEAQHKARRAAGKYIVAAIEAGIIPDTSPLVGFGAIDALLLAPVSEKRRAAAIKAFREAYPVSDVGRIGDDKGYSYYLHP